MFETVKKVILDTLLIAAVSGVFVMWMFASPVEIYQRGGWELLWAYYWRSGLSSALIWQGNAYLSNLPDRWLPWIEAPIRRLIISVAITVVFTCLIWILIYWLFLTNDYGWNLVALVRDMKLRDFVPTLIITIFISLFMHGRAFFISWKATLVEAERLKKEQLSARYETLKSQVNPHFLFNSLNVLASLVHKDADQAELFIRQLATVYRYILESRDKEVVPLEEELSILRAYLFLMDIRFGAGLRADIRVAEPAPGRVAPLTLQMLVENALKHNEVSKANPLQIEVFRENGYLVVRNTLQPKTTLPESTGLGLANIQARYQALSDKPVLISDNDGFFTVKTPILSAS